MMFVYGKNPSSKLQLLGSSKWFTVKDYCSSHPIWREKWKIKYLFFGYCILETVVGKHVGSYEASTSSRVPVLVWWCVLKKNHNQQQKNNSQSHLLKRKGRLCCLRINSILLYLALQTLETAEKIHENDSEPGEHPLYW